MEGSYRLVETVDESRPSTEALPPGTFQVDDGAFMVLSLPVAAFAGIEDVATVCGCWTPPVLGRFAAAAATGAYRFETGLFGIAGEERALRVSLARESDDERQLPTLTAEPPASDVFPSAGRRKPR